jgi:hypothetical protein
MDYFGNKDSGISKKIFLYIIQKLCSIVKGFTYSLDNAVYARCEGWFVKIIKVDSRVIR